MTRRPEKAGNFTRLGVFILVLGLWVTLALAPFPLMPVAGAQLPGFGKYRVVRIDKDGLSPRAVQIERGVTVIWFNATDTHSAVVFNDGELLRRSTRSPTLFFLAPDGTYVSTAFGPGSVASTAFVRAGTYNYFVTGLSVEEGEAFGRVIVR